jgi:hypothetical protein
LTSEKVSCHAFRGYGYRHILTHALSPPRPEGPSRLTQGNYPPRHDTSPAEPSSPRQRADRGASPPPAGETLGEPPRPPPRSPPRHHNSEEARHSSLPQGLDLNSAGVPGPPHLQGSPDALRRVGSRGEGRRHSGGGNYILGRHGNPPPIVPRPGPPGRLSPVWSTDRDSREAVTHMESLGLSREAAHVSPRCMTVRNNPA